MNNTSPAQAEQDQQPEIETLSKKQWDAELMSLHTLLVTNSPEYRETAIRLAYRTGVSHEQILDRMGKVVARVEYEQAVSENRLEKVDRNAFTNAILESEQLTDRQKVIALAVNSFAGGSNPYIFAGATRIAKRAGGCRPDTTHRVLTQLEEMNVLRRVKIHNLPPEIREIAQRVRKDKRAVGFCLNDPSDWWSDDAYDSCPSATFSSP